MMRETIQHPEGGEPVDFLGSLETMEPSLLNVPKDLDALHSKTKKQLVQMGALDDKNQLIEIGEAMKALDLPMRSARTIIEARLLQEETGHPCLLPATTIAAYRDFCFTNRGIYQWPDYGKWNDLLNPDHIAERRKIRLDVKIRRLNLYRGNSDLEFLLKVIAAVRREELQHGVDAPQVKAWCAQYSIDQQQLNDFFVMMDRYASSAGIDVRHGTINEQQCADIEYMQGSDIARILLAAHSDHLLLLEGERPSEHKVARKLEGTYDSEEEVADEHHAEEQRLRPPQFVFPGSAGIWGPYASQKERNERFHVMLSPFSVAADNKDLPPTLCVALGFFRGKGTRIIGGVRHEIERLYCNLIHPIGFNDLLPLKEKGGIVGFQLNYSVFYDRERDDLTTPTGKISIYGEPIAVDQFFDREAAIEALTSALVRNDYKNPDPVTIENARKAKYFSDLYKRSGGQTPKPNLDAWYVEQLRRLGYIYQVKNLRPFMQELRWEEPLLDPEMLAQINRDYPLNISIKGVVYPLDYDYVPASKTFHGSHTAAVRDLPDEVLFAFTPDDIPRIGPADKPVKIGFGILKKPLDEWKKFLQTDRKFALKLIAENSPAVTYLDWDAFNNDQEVITALMEKPELFNKIFGS